MEVRKHRKQNCLLLNAHKRYYFIKHYLYTNILLIYFYSHLSEETGYVCSIFLQIVPGNWVELTLTRLCQLLLCYGCNSFYKNINYLKIPQRFIASY
jgi:hypothetical protein